MDKYKQFDIVEVYTNFLKEIKKLKPYMVDFFEDNVMKPKVYSFNYKVKNENSWLIIVITYDEYIFFVNNKVWKA